MPLIILSRGRIIHLTAQNDDITSKRGNHNLKFMQYDKVKSPIRPESTQLAAPSGKSTDTLHIQKNYVTFCSQRILHDK